MAEQRVRQMFSDINAYIHVAEYISGEHWWLDKHGDNWWNRKERFRHHAIYLPTVGEFDLKIGTEWHHITPGDLVYIPADSELEFYLDGQAPVEKYYIHFDLTFGGNRLVDFFKIPHVVHLEDTQRIEATMRELRRLCVEESTPVSQLAANGLLLSLVAQTVECSEASFVRTTEKLEREMRDTLEYINAHIGESLSVVTLAERVGYSAPYFTKKFKKAFGTTPTEYVANLKISYAKTWLISGEMSVSGVAAALGFCDASYFSNFFKSKTGLYPGYYRKKNK